MMIMMEFVDENHRRIFEQRASAFHFDEQAANKSEIHHVGNSKFIWWDGRLSISNITIMTNSTDDNYQALNLSFFVFQRSEFPFRFVDLFTEPKHSNRTSLRVSSLHQITSPNKFHNYHRNTRKSFCVNCDDIEGVFKLTNLYTFIYQCDK